jgi:glucose/arabinose dehydrogenase
MVGRRAGVGLAALALVVTVLAACTPADPPGTIKVDFGPVGAAVNAGYVGDHGEAFSSSSGRGWISQTSTTPLSIVGNGRERNLTSDQKIDTFIHMQFTGTTGGVAKPARWEQVVANGVYDVTVAVGDPANATDSNNRITLESTNVIAGFHPTTTNKIATVTSRVRVSDGKLTVDAAGGTNTKLDYIDIVPVTGTSGIGATIARVNFQPGNVPVPYGYTADNGGSYTAARGFGWVSETSSTGKSIVGNAIDRNATPDQRNDTFMQMQLSPARWEYAVPDGTYDVRVQVGDAKTTTGSTHTISVEGQVAINGFVASSAEKFRVATVRVDVTDGRVTLDAAGGTNTKIDYVDIVDANNTARTILSSDPANGATNVDTTTSVSLAPSAEIDFNTLNSGTVKLLRPDNTQVPGHYNSDAAGGTISFTPSAQLATNTKYTIQTTSGLKDTDGNPYAPFTASFTTGASSLPPPPVNFIRTTLSNIDGPTSIVIGPDKNMYVGTAVGQIYRYPINGQNGKFSAGPTILNPFGQFTRTITGLAIDPSSTSTSVKLWVSHGLLQAKNVPNFTGKVSLVSGANLAAGQQTVRDKIVQLPRSVRDHMNNGIVFGPDGRLYIAQGAMSGYGGADPNWGFRAETPLSASILVADVLHDSRFAGTSSVNVNTDNGYNPKATNAPVKVYAEGTRNPFDLVWTSAGSLYAPVNESAQGNTPAGPNNNPVALTGLGAGRDYLAKVIEGRYYGHPNPSQGHYVLNGGNPTNAIDPFETPEYPVGTQPDAKYQRPILDLGLHRSADGIDEYTPNKFGSVMQGKLVIAEFSNGDDIIAVNPNNTSDRFQVASGFFNPLDVRVSQSTGRIYVAEFGNEPDGTGGHITLLTPDPK